MNKLPEEIIQKILSYTQSRVSIALGRAPNARTLFYEGGPTQLLISVLKHGGDIKSLFYLIPYIPADIALAKAVETADPTLVRRVSILWDSRTSDYAFAVACNAHFEFAIRHIQPSTPPSPAQANRLYFELAEYDRIDLTIPDPFSDFNRIPFPTLASRIDRYTPYQDTLSYHELLLLFLIGPDKTKAVEILEQDDECQIDLLEVLGSALTFGAAPLWIKEIYDRFGSRYNLTYELMCRTLIEIRHLDAIQSFGIPQFEIHQAILSEDIDRLNRFLVDRRHDTLQVISLYDKNYASYQAYLLEHDRLLLDKEGYWQGAPNSIKRFMFGLPYYRPEARVRDSIDQIKRRKISSLEELYRGLDSSGGGHSGTLSARALYTFIETYGDQQALAVADTPVFLLPDEPRLIHLVFQKAYPLKPYDQTIFRHRKVCPILQKRQQLNIPSLFIYNQTLYYDLICTGSYLDSNELDQVNLINNMILSFKFSTEMNS